MIDMLIRYGRRYHAPVIGESIWVPPQEEPARLPRRQRASRNARL